jgi:hypothetical protein
MGMYTELYLTCRFKKDLPEEVIAVLKHLFGDFEDAPPTELPDHTFFECDRWKMIGRCSSHYFVPMATSNLYFNEGNTDQYFLTTRSDLKDYGGEIQKFLNWVMPYIEAYEGDHLGHYRYEEEDQPKLIFYPKVV